MAVDPLSDLLKTVRLTGAAFFDLACQEPWAVGSPPRDVILPKILPDADHLIAYHVVTSGRCFASIVGGQSITVETGEVVVFTNCDPHVMSSGPGMQAGPTTKDVVDLAAASQKPFHIRCGGDGPGSTNLVCGYLACDAWPFNPLLDHLPPVIKVGNSNNDDAGWLSQFVRFALAEAAGKRAGSETVLTKLSELMFIDVLRRYIESIPSQQAGWLAGLRDPSIGKALSLMHEKPGQNWTIEELAKRVGVSRSVLAERFTQLVGAPPMQYLAKWRMQIASERLRSGNASVASIAAEIGYDSEATFSRAFKKMIGMPPSAWRRRARPQDA